MKRSLAAVLSICLSMWMSGAANAAEVAITAGELRPFGYQPMWDQALDMADSGPAVAAYLLDDNLYVVTANGDVLTVRADVGLLRWTQHVADSVTPIFEPTHSAGPDGRPLVIFETTRRTMIFDRYSGDIVADMPMDKAVSSPAVAYQNMMFFGSYDGHMYSVLWGDPRSTSAIPRWRVIAGGPVTSKPVLAAEGENLIFASQGGSVYSCTAAFKILNWEFRTGGPVTGDIFVDPSGTYVASTDRSLYRLDTVSGVQRWRVRFPEPLGEGPVAVGGVVYQFNVREGIAAVDADRGEVMWHNGDARYFLCRHADRDLFLTDSNRLLMIDVKTGQSAASAPLATPVLPARNTESDALYLVSQRGVVLCARPIGAAYLTPEDMAAAGAGLHRPPTATAPADQEQSESPELPRTQHPFDLNDPLRSRADHE